MITKKNSYITSVILLSVLLTGCLKEKDGLASDMLNDPGKTVVEFIDPVSLRPTTSDPDDVYVVAVNESPAQEEIVVGTLRVASPQLGVKGSVKLTEDPSLLAAAHLESFPAGAITWITDLNNVQFSTTSRNIELRVRINKALIDLSKSYGLALKVSDPMGAIVNERGNAIITNVVVKNKFDGVYEVTGNMVDLTTAALTGTYPLTWELRTTGANTLSAFDQGTGTQTHLILNNGSLSQYGTFGLDITIDPITNKVTRVVNSHGQPAANGRSAVLDPTGVNAYDPATRTFRIKYFMLQPGTTVRTTFDETWTFTSER